LGLAFCFEIGEGKVSRHMAQTLGLVRRMLVVGVVVVVVGVVGVVIVVVAKGGGLHGGE
jgi:hypothetical protein